METESEQAAEPRYFVCEHRYGSGSVAFDVIPMTSIDAYAGRNILATDLSFDEADMIRKERQAPKPR